MTITLGGITIDDDMYLSGIETNAQVVVEQQRTIDGLSILRVRPTPAGRSLTLGTQNSNGSIQGIWEWSTVSAIKALELLAASVILDYRGTIYNVFVVGTNLTPFLQFELEGSNKKFTGTVSLMEA